VNHESIDGDTTLSWAMTNDNRSIVVELLKHDDVTVNHQNSDGTVTIPKALRPYMGGQELIAPKR
jgi:ankyrin repeat protein